jgi:hypothetical protein
MFLVCNISQSYMYCQALTFDMMFVLPSLISQPYPQFHYHLCSFPIALILLIMESDEWRQLSTLVESENLRWLLENDTQ